MIVTNKPNTQNGAILTLCGWIRRHVTFDVNLDDKHNCNALGINLHLDTSLCLLDPSMTYD